MTNSTTPTYLRNCLRPRYDVYSTPATRFPPTHPDGEEHPFYDGKYGALLQFGHYGEGVDYEPVIYACCVVMGNAWPLEMMGHTRIDSRLDGGLLTYAYLSLSNTPDTKQAIGLREHGGILREPIYILHNLEGGVYYYPFTPSFDHSVFPHDDIPPPWQCVQIASSP
ncbi:uncharacterized protein F4812DRAFT_444077, partial [Daldinia caldariorum]|uniref:uncharacterized protein n=1 Tax=Daldinia caldariorum TaxID=326644 RepID=UPI0020081F38